METLKPLLKPASLPAKPVTSIAWDAACNLVKDAVTFNRKPGAIRDGVEAVIRYSEELRGKVFLLISAITEQPYRIVSPESIFGSPPQVVFSLSDIPPETDTRTCMYLLTVRDPKGGESGWEPPFAPPVGKH